MSVGRMNLFDNNVSTTGASGAIPRSDLRRRTEHAKMYYSSVRKMTGDVIRIAQHTGLSLDEVKRIKEHIFINKYDLGYDEPTTFDEDCDIAHSWQRLIDGKDIQEMDRVLMYHELAEYYYMHEKLMTYDDAHTLAQSQYNY